MSGTAGGSVFLQAPVAQSRALSCSAVSRSEFQRPGSSTSLRRSELAEVNTLVLSATRQAYHVSDAGPASTSEQGAMNGSTADSGVNVRLSQKLGHIASKPSEAAVPVNYKGLFSKEAQLRLMPGLRVLATSFNNLPDMIPLHGGLPPASAFPLRGMQLTLKDGTKIDITDPQEMLEAQQYNLTMRGLPKVLDWVVEHTRRLHNPSEQHQTVLTGGSNYTIEILTRLFLEAGDDILCEEYTYPHVPESMVLPAGYRSVAVKIDDQGIIPELLLHTLEAMVDRGERTPKLLYTIPVGQNPTGATQTTERKRAVYDICRRFDILILEDDPYYCLQYTVGEPPRGLQNLGQSYLSMDTDARVCRLDTFSKTLAPGLRVGWLTAHSAVIEKVLIHFHGIAMGACSLSQVVMGAILQQLGHEGFEAHIKDVQEQYSRRAGIITAAADKHLTGLAEWSPITAGMFMWLKLLGFEDASQILPVLQEAKVVVVPGKLTRHSGPGTKTPCPYIRLSFVTAPEERLEVAIARLADLLSNYRNKAGLTSCESKPVAVLLDHGEVL